MAPSSYILAVTFTNIRHPTERIISLIQTTEQQIKFEIIDVIMLLQSAATRRLTEPTKRGRWYPT